MTSVLLSSTDPRGPKAVALATDAGQWLKCRTSDGRKAYGIPSSKGDGRYYLTTRTSCDCYDAQRHECKHMLAVRLHCEFVAEQEARASVGPDNIVLFDQTVAAIRTAAAQAAKAEDIFKRFEDDEPTDLSRILGKPRRGVIPASQIERED